MHPQCVLDAFIKQHKEDMSSGTQYPIDERDLVQMVVDYFGPGNISFLCKNIEWSFIAFW